MAMFLAQYAHARALRRERVFRDRLNPMDDYSDKRMHKYYRFTRNGVMRVIDMLVPHLQNQTARSHAIDPRLQVFVALRFYATGDFYSSVSAHHGISDSSVCRIVNRVTDVLVGMKEEYVKWPTTPEEVTDSQLGFFQLCGFPRVVGALDCTHVPLDCAPLGPAEHCYINRKGWHSINVQLICTSDYKITNVVARWPGSLHDQRILKHSSIWDLYEQDQLQGVLLGDSGYQPQTWLMAPYRRVTTAAEREYINA